MQFLNLFKNIFQRLKRNTTATNTNAIITRASPKKYNVINSIERIKLLDDVNNYLKV